MGEIHIHFIIWCLLSTCYVLGIILGVGNERGEERLIRGGAQMDGFCNWKMSISFP